MKRIKSLDGIRGILIIVILLAHALITMPDAITSNKLIMFYIHNIGELSVRIFFVMSGYLITKLLMLEEQKKGKVSLQDFYIRRMYRIFPTFFLYIGAILLLKWTIFPNIFENYGLVFYAVFYLWNYKHFFTPVNLADNGEWFMGHFWSLSMEEQFYLLWPVTFVKFKKPTLIKILIIMIFIIPFIRSATFLLVPNSRMFVGAMLHTAGDAILVGCLAALIESSEFYVNKCYPFIKNNFVIFLSAAFLFVVSPALTFYYLAAYNYTIGLSLNNISSMAVLFWCMYEPSKISNLLNKRFISKVGLASYSLYIWQQLFLNDKSNFWITKFPQNLIAAIIVGFGSHYFAEKPILNLKNRFSKTQPAVKG